VSVLVIEPTDEVGTALVTRLLDQDDEVRVVAADPHAAQRWQALGAHVARGDAHDPDLIERAAQNVRTIVVLEEPSTEVVAAVTGGGQLASPQMRLVLWLREPRPSAEEIVRGSGLDYVFLRGTPTAGRFVTAGRKRAALQALVEAIDAADDLSGNPRLDLDLTSSAAWRNLGLDPPQR
jgi:hypothetical protein